MTLQETFGQIDIYLFDQILRGNITPAHTILDAGCGYGRNLVYLLRNHATIFALDSDPEAVDHVRRLAAELHPTLPAANFRAAGLDRMPFPPAFAHVVLCNSVLHFARDRAHFLAMLTELWRTLAPGGLLFIRLGTRIGMSFPRVREDIYRIGDNQHWFLPDEPTLLALTAQLDAILVDPLKTTIVQDYRCMTTWVLRKRYDCKV